LVVANNIVVMKTVKQVAMEERKRVITFLCGWHPRIGEKSIMTINNISAHLGKEMAEILHNNNGVVYQLIPQHGICVTMGETTEKIIRREEMKPSLHPFLQMVLKSDMRLFVIKNIPNSAWNDTLFIFEYTVFSGVFRAVYTLEEKRISPIVQLLMLDGKTHIGIFGGQICTRPYHSKKAEFVDCATWNKTISFECPVSGYIDEVYQYGDGFIIVSIDGGKVNIYCITKSGALVKKKEGLTCLRNGLCNLFHVWKDDKLYYISYCASDTIEKCIAHILQSQKDVAQKLFCAVCFDVGLWQKEENIDHETILQYFRNELCALESIGNNNIIL
jgi:hypothetical protein